MAKVFNVPLTFSEVSLIKRLLKASGNTSLERKLSDFSSSKPLSKILCHVSETIDLCLVNVRENLGHDDCLPFQAEVYVCDISVDAYFHYVGYVVNTGHGGEPEFYSEFNDANPDTSNTILKNAEKEIAKHSWNPFGDIKQPYSLADLCETMACCEIDSLKDTWETAAIYHFDDTEFVKEKRSLYHLSPQEQFYPAFVNLDFVKGPFKLKTR